eukprot:GHVO01050696.1.p1 GENE.GHVO01050696.1~~GHVO01050696.1.p1  ORF type:complete len:643 (+),score=125.85 GHVO01050696.1:40-1968(+)
MDQSDEDEQEMARMCMPLSFGKGSKPVAAETTFSSESIGKEVFPKGHVAIPGKRSVPKQRERLSKLSLDDDDEAPSNSPCTVSNAPPDCSGDRSDDDDDDAGTMIRFDRSVSIPSHIKSVSAVSINAAGSRMVTAGFDHEVRMWDFHGMNASMKPFRTFSASAGHVVQALDFGGPGQNFLGGGGDPVCRIYDHDGKKLQETVKGDMYVRDLSHTKGHTHAIHDCMWHPIHKEKFLTASMDATVRLWDLESALHGIDQNLAHVSCLKAVDRRNLNITNCGVRCASYAPTGSRFIVGGCSDGSIQYWHERKNYGKPDKVVRGHHTDSITGLCIAECESKLYTRSMDDTIMVWDIRNPMKPLHTINDLPCDATNMNIGESPCGQYIYTPVSTGRASRGKPRNAIEIFDSTTFDHVQTLPFTTDASWVSRAVWHRELNQMISTHSDGSTRMMYNKEKSRKGALLFVSKPEPKTVSEAEGAGWSQPVFTLDSLPQGLAEGADGNIKKLSQHQMNRMEKQQAGYMQKKNVPQKPTQIQTRQLVTSDTLTGHIIQQSVAAGATIKDQDPSEVLRSFNDVTESRPLFIKTAYALTQPKTILDMSMEVGDDEDMLRSVKKCPRCGLKLCQCGYMKMHDAIKGPPPKQAKRS